MKRLTIENWDTSRKITQWEYNNGLVIGEATDKSTMYGGAYIYRFYKRGEHILSITISRAEAGGKFAIRGQLYDMGRYSNIHNLSKDMIANTGHIRYVFNEIINELC
jgi:hypothetical protein